VFAFVPLRLAALSWTKHYVPGWHMSSRRCRKCQ